MNRRQSDLKPAPTFFIDVQSLLYFPGIIFKYRWYVLIYQNLKFKLINPYGNFPRRSECEQLNENKNTMLTV